MKKCSKCKKLKNENEFYKDARIKSGLSSICKKCKKERIKQSRIKNPEIFRKRLKDWRIKNTDKTKKHRLNRKIKINLYFNNRRKTDVNFKILCNLRHRVGQALKNKKVIKSQHTMNLLGCNLEYLKQHLQETAIKNGYKDFNINNYNKDQYHIDHILPVSSWNLSCSYHQKLCFNWSNLQILTKKENLEKSNKIL